MRQKDERRSSTTARILDRGLHMRGSPLHDCRKAARRRPLSLQSVPAAIRECVLDGRLHPPQRINDRRRDGVFEDIGTSGLRVLRRYCPRCGSPLTTEPDLTPELFMIKAGTLDSSEWFHPVWELFVGRRRPWVSPVPGAKQFDSNPDI